MAAKLDHALWEMHRGLDEAPDGEEPKFAVSAERLAADVEDAVNNGPPADVARSRLFRSEQPPDALSWVASCTAAEWDVPCRSSGRRHRPSAANTVENALRESGGAVGSGSLPRRGRRVDIPRRRVAAPPRGYSAEAGRGAAAGAARIF